MEKKTKIIIGVSAAVVVGGVILLVLANKKKKKIAACTANGGMWDKATKSCVDPVTNEVINITSDGLVDEDSSGGGVISGGGSSSSRPSTGFTTKSEGDAFRLWVNTKYPLYAKSIFLDKSGDYDNSYIRKAYEKYGTEYRSQTSQPHLLAAQYLGANAKINSNNVVVVFNSGKHKAVFYDNGRFVTSRMGGSGYVSKGNYIDGGKILVITDGANAGKTKKNGSVWTNLRSTL
jgi:hypothetical protein